MRKTNNGTPGRGPENFPETLLAQRLSGVTGWLHDFEDRPIEQGPARDEKHEKRPFVDRGASARMRSLV